MSEVSTAIEVFQSELLFRKRAAARETEKKLDTEHIIADRKHQRLVNKLTNEEDVLFEQLLVGREYQRRMGDSEQGMEQAWSILSKAPLRRLVFAKIDQQQAVNEYSVLVGICPVPLNSFNRTFVRRWRNSTPSLKDVHRYNLKLQRWRKKSTVIWLVSITQIKVEILRNLSKSNLARKF